MYSLASNGGAFRAAGGDGRIVLSAAPAPTVSVATGVDPLGAAHALRLQVTVPATPDVPTVPTGSTATTAVPTPAAPRATLASTGFAAASPLGLGGVLLAAGIGLTRVGRRGAGRAGT